MKNNDIAVVIPAYNEEKSIRHIAEQALQFTNHVIVVNDGSSDKTSEKLAGLPVTLLTHLTNQGKGSSLLKGFQHAQSLNVKAAISIDADTQHNPTDIPKFIEAMHQKPKHMIIGARIYNKKEAPKLRVWANQTADFFISWAAGHYILDSQSGYRLYPMCLLKDCLKKTHPQKFAFESEILIDSARQGYASTSIPLHSYYPKNARASYYRPCLDTIKIALMVTWKIVSHGFCLPGLLRSLLQGVKTHAFRKKFSQTH